MKTKIAGIMLVLLSFFFTFVPAWVLFGKRGLDVVLCILLAFSGLVIGTVGMMLVGMKEEDKKP